MIGGTFTLSIRGYPVGVYNRNTGKYDNYDIPARVDRWTLQAALRQLPGFGGTEVFYWGDPAWHSKWMFTYFRLNWDVPDLELDGALLRGGKAGTKPQVSFFETRKYSSNLIFSPVSEQFMFQAASSPQVIVTTNSIKSACTGDCSYTFV